MRKFFTKIFDLISMGTPRSVLFVFSSILFIAAIIPTNFWNEGFWSCPIKKYIMPLIFHGYCPTSGYFAGCRCPGCGITHALSSLMHFNVTEAIYYNILVVPVFLIILYLIISSLIDYIAFKK